MAPSLYAGEIDDLPRQPVIRSGGSATRRAFICLGSQYGSRDFRLPRVRGHNLRPPGSPARAFSRSTSISGYLLKDVVLRRVRTMVAAGG